MSYLDTVKSSLGVLAFKEEELNKLVADPDATKYGFLTLALVGALVAALSISVLMENMIAYLIGIPVSAILAIVSFIIGYSVYHGLAKLFGGKATGVEYFRSLSNVMLVSILSVIPFAFLLLIPYIMVVNGFVLTKVHKLSIAKAVIVILIPLLIIFGILSLVFIGGMMMFL